MCVHGRVLLLLLFLECFGVRTPHMIKNNGF